MSKEQVSQWDDVRFGREEKRGVILGLEKHQVVFAVIGMGIAVLAVLSMGFPWGWVVGGPVVVVVAALGCTRGYGRSTLSWIAHGVTFLHGRATGQDHYIRNVKEESTVILNETSEVETEWS